MAVAAALVDGPATCRELAMRTGWAIRNVRMALMDMVRAGDVALTTPVRRPGVDRPVPVYVRACRQQAVRVEVPDLVSLWAGLARPVPVRPMAARGCMGAVM